MVSCRALCAFIFAATTAQCTTIWERQQSNFVGQITQPTPGEVLPANTPFVLGFNEPDGIVAPEGCDPDLSLSAWLTSQQPEVSQLNATGEFPVGDFVWFFGDFSVPEPGTPQVGTPLPSTLTMPDLGSEELSLFFTVVTGFQDCPSAGSSVFSVLTDYPGTE